jgi:Na+-driven multidrug efflux pump
MLGRREFSDALRFVSEKFLFVMFFGFLIGLLLVFNGGWLLGLLTDDSRIVEIGKQLLVLSLAVQAGSAANLVFGMALRTTKDSRYSATMGLLVMWLIGLPAMYLFGIVLGFGIIGIWIGKLIDESVRAFLHARRWNQQIWVRRADEIHANAKNGLADMPSCSTHT